MAVITSIGAKNAEAFEGILPQVPAGDNAFRFGLIEDGFPAAAVELGRDGDICEIDSIFVVPERRRHRHGRALLQAAEKIARQNKMSRIRACFCRDSVLEEFFSSCGYIIEEGEAVYEIEKSVLASSKHLAKLTGKTDLSLVKSLSALNKMERGSLDKLLGSSGYETFISKVPYCEQSISKAHIGTDGNVDACLLCDDQEDVLFVTLLLNDSGRENTVIQLMQGANKEIMEGDYSFERLSFFVEDAKMLTLIRTFIGDEEGIRGNILTCSAVKKLV